MLSTSSQNRPMHASNKLPSQAAYITLNMTLRETKNLLDSAKDKEKKLEDKTNNQADEILKLKEML